MSLELININNFSASSMTFLSETGSNYRFTTVYMAAI